MWNEKAFSEMLFDMHDLCSVLIPPERCFQWAIFDLWDTREHIVETLATRAETNGGHGHTRIIARLSLIITRFDLTFSRLCCEQSLTSIELYCDPSGCASHAVNDVYSYTIRRRDFLNDSRTM